MFGDSGHHQRKLPSCTCCQVQVAAVGERPLWKVRCRTIHWNILCISYDFLSPFTMTLLWCTCGGTLHNVHVFSSTPMRHDENVQTWVGRWHYGLGCSGVISWLFALVVCQFLMFCQLTLWRLRSAMMRHGRPRYIFARSQLRFQMHTITAHVHRLPTSTVLMCSVIGTCAASHVRICVESFVFSGSR